MKQFIAGLTIGILVTGAVLRAAEFKMTEGNGGIPGPFVPGQSYSFVPEHILMVPATVHCGSISPEVLEQIRKAVRP